MNERRNRTLLRLCASTALSCLILGMTPATLAQEAPATKKPAPQETPDAGKDKTRSKEPDAKPAGDQDKKPADKTAEKPAAKPADKSRTDDTTKAGDKAADKTKSPETAKPKPAPVEKPDASKGDGNDEKTVTHKVGVEESKYRTRMAKIARLRDLAEKQGNKERVAELDKLEAKAKEQHDHRIADAKAKLGDEKSKKLDTELAKGRERAHGNPHGVPPGLAKKGVTEAPGQGHKDDAGSDDHEKGKDAGKDAGKDGDKDKDKEKGKGKDKDDDHSGGGGKDKGKDKGDDKGNDKDKGKPNHGGKP